MKPIINFLVGMVLIFIVAAVHEKVLPMWLATWIALILMIALIMGNIPSSEEEC